MNISDTLTERGKLYGKFSDQAHISRAIKDGMSIGRNWRAMRSDQREALEMIAGKLARILNGDAEHFDSWHDVAGYATLIADTLKP